MLSLFSHRARSSPSCHRPAARRARQPRLESLEDRIVLSAAPTFGAALSIGNGTGSSSAIDVATDAVGNSYITGRFSGTVDFDRGVAHTGDTDILAARGSRDIFVAKYAPDNSLTWVKRMGGDSDDLSDTSSHIT